MVCSCAFSFSTKSRARYRVADRGRDWGSFTPSWAGYSPDKSPDPHRAVQNSRGVGGKGQPLWERGRWRVCVCVCAWKEKEYKYTGVYWLVSSCGCVSSPSLLRFRVIGKFVIRLPSSIIVCESRALRAQCMINSAQVMATLMTPLNMYSEEAVWVQQCHSLYIYKCDHN